MPDLEHGYKRAISEIISGIVTTIIINTIINISIQEELLDASWLLYFKLLNMFTLIALIIAMPYWGTTYLVGWLLGLIIMAQAGLVNIFDFIIYFGIPLIILIIRIMKNFGV